MKKLIKNILMLTSILGIIAITGGCSMDSDSSKDIEYVQTHTDADITKVNAKMYQKAGNKDRMGDIKFAETEAGLQMHVDMKDVRPNTEYMLAIYEVKGCDMNKKSTATKCDKTKQDISMPMLKGDKDGNIKTTYVIKGLTAAELDNKKIVLSRDNANGDMVNVGWGMLKEKSLF